jgi:cell division protein FtsI (penicillin-binding protein 3)
MPKKKEQHQNQVMQKIKQWGLPVFTGVTLVSIIGNMFCGIVTGKYEYKDNSRGIIKDRHGNYMVVNKDLNNCHILVRTKVNGADKDDIANAIKVIMPDAYTKELEEKLNTKRFFYVQRSASADICKVVRDMKLPGLEAETLSGRSVTHKAFEGLIGQTRTVDKDEYGLERALDFTLSRHVNVISSIDSNIQKTMYEHLAKAKELYKAKDVIGILMETKTGEILANVSLADPSTEPALNNFYEFGSIHKLFTAALAHENNLHTKAYDIEPEFHVVDQSGNIALTIKDVKSFRAPSPRMGVQDCVIHSCNVCMAQVGLDLPEDSMEKFYRKVNFLRPLDTSYGKAKMPVMPMDMTSQVSRARMSFGAGIMATPMHMIAAINAVVNDGVYVYPTILYKDRVRKERVFHEIDSLFMRTVMSYVTDNTSGKASLVNGIRVGAKTASVNKVIKGKVSEDKIVTAATTVFPAERPMYTMLVIFDEPQATENSFGWKTAAWNAAPVSGQLLKDIIPVLVK